MELKDIASITGKPGLFRVLKPMRNGVIVETLDEKKVKMVVSAAQRISILKEITIYTTKEEGAATLGDLLEKAKEEYGLKADIDTNDKQQLHDFMHTICPEYNQNRVRDADIKKILRWFNILGRFAPEVLEQKDAEPETAEDAKTETSGDQATTGLADTAESSETEVSPKKDAAQKKSPKVAEKSSDQPEKK